MYISIRYNPGAPKEVSSGVIEYFFVADLEIIDLERRFKALSTEIEDVYRKDYFF